jgi:HEPN domain-containing protein
MTAVEWQFEQLFNSFEKFNNGEFTFNEYLKKNLEIREQAKEMEKQQIIDAFDDGYYENGMGRYEPEEYYNETFNK